MIKDAVLVLGGDAVDFEEIVKKYGGKSAPIRLKGDQVTSGRLEEELFSPSLFGSELLIVTEADELNEAAHEALKAYVKKPTPGRKLLLHAARRTNLVTALAKLLSVHEIAEVKPWEKQAKTAEWIGSYFKERNIKIAPQTIAIIAQGIGSDRQRALMELEKLATYVQERAQVTVDDVHAIMVFETSETLWQLSEAYLKRDCTRAITILHQLLEHDVSHFLIVRHLRNSVHQALLMQSMHSNGMPPGQIQEAFSKLKGKLFDKSYAQALACPADFLSKAFLSIDKAEMALKDSPFDESLLLLKLLVYTS